MIRILTLVVLVTCIVGCPTARVSISPVQPILATDTYVHAPSGFKFPVHFGKFRRVEINQFDTDGRNIGVGYNLEEADLQIALTLYVKPALRDQTGRTLSLAEMFELEKAEIARFHQGGRLSAAWTPPQTQNREAAPGLATAFQYSQVFAHRTQVVNSLLYLFEYEGWIVKYRITYPAEQEEKANLISQVFVSGFRWSDA